MRIWLTRSVRKCEVSMRRFRGEGEGRFTFSLLPSIVSLSYVDLIEFCGEPRWLYPHRQSSGGLVVLRASCSLVSKARFAPGFMGLKASMALIRFDSSHRFFLLASVRLPLSVKEDFVMVLGIAVALASMLAGLITCRRLRLFIFIIDHIPSILIRRSIWMVMHIQKALVRL